MFVNYSLQDNSVSYSSQDPIGPTCDTEFTFVRILYVLLPLFNLSDSSCPSLTFVLNTLRGNLIMKYTSL